MTKLVATDAQESLCKTTVTHKDEGCSFSTMQVSKCFRRFSLTQFLKDIGFALSREPTTHLVCYRITATRKGDPVRLAKRGRLQREGRDAERIGEARLVPLKQLRVVADLDKQRKY